MKNYALDLSKKCVLTGVKPTGTPHIGNLVGAILPAIEMAHRANNGYIFIADLHALNSIDEPAKISQYTREIAATYLAFGVDPAKITLFRQSDVPQVSELTILLTNVTAKGLMNRSHAYKARVQENDEAGRDPDSGVNMGLFNYPILMAADILLYNADVIPVGADQKQHVEIARDIASSFNSRYGVDVLKAPTPIIEGERSAIPGTDGRKMSKSYGNTIPIFGTTKQLHKAVMSIKTDTRPPEEPKAPEEIIVYQIYKAFATPEQLAQMHEGFEKGGLGYGTAKKMLFETLEEYIAPAREQYNELMQGNSLERALKSGAEKAAVEAQKQLASVKSIMLGSSLS